MPGRSADRPAWFDPHSPCLPAPRNGRPLRLVLLGAPGVGKGTQAALLSARLGACHLSTGDVFRAAKAMTPCERSPALNAAIDAMERGELVADETVLRIIGERVACLHCQGGFLLDGFPRTLAQAYALEELLEAGHARLDAVVSYELPLELVVARIAGRRVCPACKAVYHLQARPPWRPGYCDSCDTPLVQREDDQPRAVRVRMKAYQKATAPLALHYARQRLLRQVHADGTPDQICEQTLRLLGVPAAARA